MQTVYVVVAGLGIALFALIAEALVLARARARLPIRILVTGTRGKSSVVRLIQGALTDGGISALGKTTGSAARLLPPTGEERPIRRRGGASILEQRRVLLEAARGSSRALVVEAMSIDAEVAEAESLRILRPTHVVVTNARVDHVDTTGSTVASVAETLACSIPKGMPVYALESELVDGAATALRAAGGRLIPIPVPDGEALADGVSSPTFTDHLALATRVCADVGVSPEHVARAAEVAARDLGALRLLHAA